MIYMLFKNLWTDFTLQDDTLMFTTNAQERYWQNLQTVYVEVFATKVTAELSLQLARHIFLSTMQAPFNLALAEFRVYGKICIC